MRGSNPPIHPAAKLCGSVAALFLVLAGKSSARSAVCGPTTSARMADRPIKVKAINNIDPPLLCKK